MAKPEQNIAFSYSAVRVGLHLLFWILVLLLTTFAYGFGKYDFALSLRNNICFLPIHVLYFYTVAYWLIPKYLFPKRYLAFFFFLVLLVLIVPMCTRIIDIFIAEPTLVAYLKTKGIDSWAKVEGSYFERFTNLTSYISAFKGANLVVWFAVVVKFFKLWYQRHHAALEAELRLLKGQVHPHFLFNTLNNLYALTLTNSPKSPQIVMGLSEILRYMLYECNASQVPLQKDVEILESYIMVEKLRYEERLDLHFSKSGEMQQMIAPLLLLPLVENAFKHGASAQVGEAWINIDLSVNRGILKFKITNGKPEKATESKTNAGHIGLENVRKRLELIYPKAHALKIFDEEDMFIVILEIELDKSV